MYPVRKSLKIGMLVEVESKNVTTRGYIQRIVSQAQTKKGIRVELHSGESGRVVKIITKDQVKQEGFIFYNRLLHEKSLFSLFDNQTKMFWVWEGQRTQANSLLFQKKEDAEAFLQKLKSKGIEHVSVRAIPRNKSLSSVFSKAGAGILTIDLERTIHLSHLAEVESKLR